MPVEPVLQRADARYAPDLGLGHALGGVDWLQRRKTRQELRSPLCNLGARQSPFQGRLKVLQRDPERCTESPQFNHVDTTLASLALAYKALRFTDVFRKINLREASVAARITEYLQEDPVLGRVNRLVHCDAGCNGLP
jgi:hypothetical protein